MFKKRYWSRNLIADHKEGVILQSKVHSFQALHKLVCFLSIGLEGDFLRFADQKFSGFRVSFSSHNNNCTILVYIFGAIVSALDFVARFKTTYWYLRTKNSQLLNCHVPLAVLFNFFIIVIKPLELIHLLQIINKCPKLPNIFISWKSI